MKSICSPSVAFCLLPTAALGGTCGTNGIQDSGFRSKEAEELGQALGLGQLYSEL
jgi:hypothetical protein